MSDQAKALALELSEESMALFTIEGDIPLECLGDFHVDDPDTAMRAAELLATTDVVPNGSPCEIWLSDDQIILRKAKLPAGSPLEQRDAALSALVATTAHREESLCFDIGATDLDGYTPIAAITKSKMDEVAALARTLRMNPVRTTTSDDQSGFPSRPVFEPHAPAVAPRFDMAKAAGLAAILALPVMAFFAANVERQQEPDVALIAAVSQTYVDEMEPVTVPSFLGDGRSLGRDAGANLYVPEESPAAFVRTTVASEPLSADPVLAMALAPSAPALTTEINIAPVNGLAPLDPQPIAINAIAPLDDLALPEDMPTLPEVQLESAAALIGVHDIIALLAVEDPVVAEPSDPTLVRLANIDDGVLVPVPVRRAVPEQPVVQQPLASALPRARPAAPPPEEQYDYEKLAKIRALDPPPDDSPIAPVQTSERRPTFAAPSLVSYDTLPSLAAVADVAVAEAREAAIAAAFDGAGQPGASVVMPAPRRTIAAPEGGSARIMADDVLALRSSITDEAAPTVPQALSFGPTYSADPIRVARAQPDLSMPFIDGVTIAEGSSQEDVQLAALTPREETNPLLRRGLPARRPAAADAPTEDVVEDEEAAPAEEPFDRISALARPATRPEAASAVASVPAEGSVPEGPVPEGSVSESDDANAPAAPVWRYARPAQRDVVVPTPAEEAPEDDTVVASIDPDAERVFSPLARPSTLSAQAAKILEARKAAAAQVAARQQPAKTTPRGQLRIPTTAAVSAAATIEGGINLGDVSLIGIFGQSGARRALIRMPQGRIVRVSPGQSFSGWTVSAISDEVVRIQKRGQNRVLRLPN